MYAYFKGDVTDFGPDYVIIETIGGVGYRIFTPSRISMQLLQMPSDRKIYTYTSVREDAIWLYGFIEKEDLNLFKDLINVNGVGPKAALSLLSIMDASEIKACILTQDVSTIAKAPGIGKKTAERMILDLKDRISFDEDPDQLITSLSVLPSSAGNKDHPAYKDAFDALEALGFTGAETMKMLSNVTFTDETTASEAVSEALKYNG